MTVGLYLHKPHPIIISDCLALPRDVDQRLFSPSNIEHYDGRSGTLAHLVSKYLYLDEVTVVTFAGSSNDIYEFAREFPALWEERDKRARPMKIIMEFDNSVREQKAQLGYRWDCSVLAASPFSMLGKSAGINQYASLNPNWRFETERYGICHSIGSGAAELRKFVEDLDGGMAIDPMQQKMDFLEMLGAFNGKTLFAQGLDGEEKTWGGVLQAQIYQQATNSWIRTPAWAHVCLYFKGADLKFVGANRKIVVHKSRRGDNYSTGLTIFLGNNDRIFGSSFFWPITSPFTRKEDQLPLDRSELQEIPRNATITIFIHGEHRSIVFHVTDSTSNIDGLIFSRVENSYSIDVNYDAISSWVRPIIRAGPNMDKVKEICS